MVEKHAARASKGKKHTKQGYAGENRARAVSLSEVPAERVQRLNTHDVELNRVLGGGLVTGSLVLIGGDPGIGKSTLLLQTLTAMAQDRPVLYVSGEESLSQIAMRAKRAELAAGDLKLLTQTSMDHILAAMDASKPEVVVMDSIQTLYSPDVSSAPGSVSQLRECALQLVQYAKQTQTSIFIVGHVTKDGHIAGPRVLEHMVDVVLYFEGQQDQRYRMIRAMKNRFGPVNELGIFAMTEKGLKAVSNPSLMFLSRHEAPGGVVTVTWGGTRPLLVEVQALADQSQGQPRRVVIGLDSQRLALLLAVLHRHGQVAAFDQDVFVNVVGGLKIQETAADLAVMLAVASSLRHRVLPAQLVVFGEVGLAGEIRPVPFGVERLKEAAKHGFTQAIVPKANVGKGLALEGVTLHAVERVDQALAVVREMDG